MNQNARVSLLHKKIHNLPAFLVPKDLKNLENLLLETSHIRDLLFQSLDVGSMLWAANGGILEKTKRKTVKGQGK